MKNMESVLPCSSDFFGRCEDQMSVDQLNGLNSHAWIVLAVTLGYEFSGGHSTAELDYRISGGASAAYIFVKCVFMFSQ